MKTANAFHSRSRLVSSSALAVVLGCAPGMPARPDQVCQNVVAGDLVVTEFMADPAGIDTGKQYIEIYNTTDRVIDLSGLSLFQSLADGSRLNSIALYDAQIAAHAYFVLGDTGTDANARPAFINYGYGSALGALRHENGRLGLRCAAAVITDVTYTQVTAGHSRELDGSTAPNATLNHDGSNWCDATEPLSSLEPEGENYGSPGTANSACPGAEALPDSGATLADATDSGVSSGQCFDTITGASRDQQRPKFGDLQISEIMSAPSTGNNGPGEWFEVLANNDVDLSARAKIMEPSKAIWAANQALVVAQ